MANFLSLSCQNSKKNTNFAQPYPSKKWILMGVTGYWTCVTQNAFACHRLAIMGVGDRRLVIFFFPVKFIFFEFFMTTEWIAVHFGFVLNI